MDRSDVSIIGGGIAGIATALDLLDGGKSVLLLDRDEEGAFGGLARESFGGMFFVNSPVQRRQGIRDSAELALRDWQSFAEFGPEDDLAEGVGRGLRHALHRGCLSLGPPLRRELPARGELGRARRIPSRKFGAALPFVWGTGKGMAEALIGALRAHPNAGRLTLRFNQRVERLTLRGGRIDGAAGSMRRAARRSRSRPSRWWWPPAASMAAICRGCGRTGTRDWGTPPVVLLNGSHRFADGKLHDATADVGGVLTHLDQMWNYAAGVHHPRPRKAQARAVAGAAALGALAQLARRAHRAAASGLGLRHAPAGHRHLRAGAAIFLAAHEPADRAEGAGDLRRRAQSVDPRQEASWDFCAISCFGNRWLVQRDDRELPGFCHGRDRCPSWSRR